VNVTLVVVCGLCFGLGVAGLFAALSTGSSEPTRQARSAAASKGLRRHLPKLALAGSAGVLAGIVSGWPAAVPIVSVAVYGVPKLFQQTSGSRSIIKIESIALWTEMLQGTLAASAGLSQAIMATAPLSPPPIRAESARLSARLGAGMHPREALLQFAEEVDDPCADRVVCALLLAVSSRAQRLGDLLVVLADSTRDEVALRLRIETSRASIRSGVRTVLVFSLAFALGLAILAHAYLAPFGTPMGQLMLMVVGFLYATGLVLMVGLARPPAPVRLLGPKVLEQ
jgi:Flp pilus assembly protein TadB